MRATAGAFSVTHIDIDLYQKIIKEAAQYAIGTKELPIGLCGIGEPLLHPEFPALLEIAEAHNVPVGVGSNGGLLHKYVDTIVKFAPAQVVFSIDAVTAWTHKKMRPGVGFLQTVEAIDEYVRKVRRAKAKPKNLWLQILVSELNNHEVESFIEHWLPRIEGIPGAKLFVKCVCPWPYHDANGLYPSPKPQMSQVYFDHPLIDVGEFGKPITFRDDCALFDGFAQVMSDGAYVPCCMCVHDPWGIGNTKDNTLRELFNSEKMRGMRDMPKSELPFCKDCI